MTHSDNLVEDFGAMQHVQCAAIPTYQIRDTRSKYAVGINPTMPRETIRETPGIDFGGHRDIAIAGSLRADPIYPDVVNTSHATPEVAAFFKSYFTAKSEHKPVPTSDHFSGAHLTYIDAALGWSFYDKKGMTDIFEQYMPKWPPTGLSYPTRISGDTHSALISFTDTPELFGGEIRILAAVDFKDGKVVRWIDYWDGRSFGAETAAKMRTPPDKFPTN